MESLSPILDRRIGDDNAGAFDIAFLRCVPNMAVLTPSDEDECRKALSTAFGRDHPVAVRYPRGAGIGKPGQATLETLRWGRGESRLQARAQPAPPAVGRRIAILAFGTLLYAGHDWMNPALARRSMELMATEVMPRVNHMIGAS